MKQETAQHVRNMRTTMLLSVLVPAAAACAGTRATEGPATPTPTLVTYQPFDATYRGVTHRTVRQEFDGQEVTNESGIGFSLSTRVVFNDTLLEASMVIDSVTDVRGIEGPMVRAQIDSARGASYTGALGPYGMLGDWSGGETAGSIAQQLSDQFLSDFFPRLPIGGVQPGLSWSDTVSTSADVGGVENTIEAVRQHRATDWTEFAGQPALEILTDSRYTFSGRGIRVGQEFTLAGEGVRHSSHYLTPGGGYLGSISADTSEAEAEIVSAGIAIPVKQMRTDSIIKMP